MRRHGSLRPSGEQPGRKTPATAVDCGGKPLPAEILTFVPVPCTERGEGAKRTGSHTGNVTARGPRKRNEEMTSRSIRRTGTTAGVLAAVLAVREPRAARG